MTKAREELEGKIDEAIIKHTAGTGVGSLAEGNRELLLKDILTAVREAVEKLPYQKGEVDKRGWQSTDLKSMTKIRNLLGGND